MYFSRYEVVWYALFQPVKNRRAKHIVLLKTVCDPTDQTIPVDNVTIRKDP